jgi:hypothetical protein
MLVAPGASAETTSGWFATVLFFAEALIEIVIE